MKTPETKDQLRISVKAENLVYVGDKVVREDQVDEALKEVFKRSPDREIVVKGDRTINYGAVLNVLKACRDVGFENVGLIAQPAKSAGGVEG